MKTEETKKSITVIEKGLEKTFTVAKPQTEYPDISIFLKREMKAITPLIKNMVTTDKLINMYFNDNNLLVLYKYRGLGPVYIKYIKECIIEYFVEQLKSDTKTTNDKQPDNIVTVMDNDEREKLIIQMIESGATITETAEAFGVKRSTFQSNYNRYKYKKDAHDAVKNGIATTEQEMFVFLKNELKPTTPLIRYKITLTALKDMYLNDPDLIKLQKFRGLGVGCVNHVKKCLEEYFREQAKQKEIPIKLTTLTDCAEYDEAAQKQSTAEFVREIKERVAFRKVEKMKAINSGMTDSELLFNLLHGKHRLYNPLTGDGIYTVATLLEMYNADNDLKGLRHIRNLGPFWITCIKTYIQEYLALKNSYNNTLILTEKRNKL